MLKKIKGLSSSLYNCNRWTSYSYCFYCWSPLEGLEDDLKINKSNFNHTHFNFTLIIKWNCFLLPMWGSTWYEKQNKKYSRQFIYSVVNSSSQGYCYICLTYFNGGASLVGLGVVLLHVMLVPLMSREVESQLGLTNIHGWMSPEPSMCVCIYFVTPRFPKSVK